MTAFAPSIWDTVPRVADRTGVTRTDFERGIVPAEHPVVLRGLVSNWLATGAGRRSQVALSAYLAPLATDAPVETWVGTAADAGQFRYGSDFAGFNFERRQIGFIDLLALLRDAAAGPVYAGAVRIPQVLPALLDEIPMPLLDPALERLTSLWIGNGSRTLAHWDLPRNLACVIAGRRRFIVLPPDQLPNLYVGPIDVTLAGQPASLVDFANPDFARYPRFRDAMATAQVADLEPGDALYLPSLWWHHVETPPPFGAQVNFWWRDAADHMVTPQQTLLHALLTIRDLPPAERTAWRAHFDHYVFQTGGDPVAHLPPDARGVLGPMTSSVVERIRQLLRRSLGG